MSRTYNDLLKRINELEEDLEQCKKEYAQLEKKAEVDFLTGVANRYKAVQLLEEEISYCRRTKIPLSLIFFDIDDFKKINDHYGHPAGDQVLRGTLPPILQTRNY